MDKIVFVLHDAAQDVAIYAELWRLFFEPPWLATEAIHQVVTETRQPGSALDITQNLPGRNLDDRVSTAADLAASRLRTPRAVPDPRRHQLRYRHRRTPGNRAHVPCHVSGLQ